MTAGSQAIHKIKSLSAVRRWYPPLASRAYSVITFAALFCTLAVKFFHAWRTGLLNEYLSWISADVSALLGIEVILALLCFRWHNKWLIRAACICAAVICTWSVMNAGWLIRTGTQILPTAILPLFRDPINALSITGVNIAKMPAVAAILLVPSAAALALFIPILIKSPPPRYNPKLFAARIAVSVLLVLAAAAYPHLLNSRRSPQIASEDLSYNSQLRAIMSLLSSDSAGLAKVNLTNNKHHAFGNLHIAGPHEQQKSSYNLILVVLEGVQYRYTFMTSKAILRLTSLLWQNRALNLQTPAPQSHTQQKSCSVS
jgi:hypothetical protein